MSQLANNVAFVSRIVSQKCGAPTKACSRTRTTSHRKDNEDAELTTRLRRIVSKS